MKKKIIVLVAISLLACGAFTGCGEKEGKKEEVKTVEKTEDKIEGYIEYKNEELGIELLYPQEIKIIEETRGKIKLSGIVDRLEDKSTEDEKKTKKKTEGQTEEEKKERQKEPLNLEIIFKEMGDISIKDIFESRINEVPYKKNQGDFAVCEDDFYVLSWENDNRILYEKAIVKGGKVYSFKYSYAKDKKENYNEVISTTQKSFKKK